MRDGFRRLACRARQPPRLIACDDTAFPARSIDREAVPRDLMVNP
jgi:hypothetical protein